MSAWLRRSATSALHHSFRCGIASLPVANITTEAMPINMKCPREVKLITSTRSHEPTGRIAQRLLIPGIQAHHFGRRDQRADCCAPRAAGRPLLPLDRDRSTSQTARSSRATSVWTDRISGSFSLKLASSLRLRGFTHFVSLAPTPLARPNSRPKPQLARF